MKRRVNKIDKIIGANLRFYRLMRGMTQERLGLEVGLSFQQIQKYENATNRVTVSTLINISNVLNLPMVMFWTERRISD
ncbi:transcriptional regulator with XRE-family HTH domain [Bradyrhizobium sp. USDA 4524]|uniref:helix-turn-helix domain-containing protein n=1 Tax=unclassified Bradyrhizobium TaxID=2631580 RepID=UPI00209F8C3E|nr:MULTISPECIES: helix-turn-helix transcriptional regulator [unclassified Bradyrhizobium]MCP1839126.1 transcriptional regulator with XRE-family HTH domain [Bradyrhizobium sp. USDA 4538]MCP1899691.1 transcriptional regulator with XRE-family HTH domain [Bradyrhizobium sp. USDA 4537]MCP1986199.1 transcriptional regulator with XRE-family HTH domain [Bradyrhizobium sp. USDA 4539]